MTRARQFRRAPSQGFIRSDGQQTEDCHASAIYRVDSNGVLSGRRRRSLFYVVRSDIYALRSLDRCWQHQWDMAAFWEHP